MTSYARQAIILGLIVTLLVVGIELLGGFSALERETIGLRVAHAWWRSPVATLSPLSTNSGWSQVHSKWAL